MVGRNLTSRARTLLVDRALFVLSLASVTVGIGFGVSWWAASIAAGSMLWWDIHQPEVRK